MQPLAEKPHAASGQEASMMRDVAPESKDTMPGGLDGLRQFSAPVAEIGGPAGPEPVRYGDWERRGRCIDF
jgi:hypothetical protein